MVDKVPLLAVDQLTIDFATRGGLVHAVDNVSWQIDAGETLAILGESGSGKSVSASAVLNLVDVPPGIIRGGDIRYRGQSILNLDREKRRQINGNKIAMVFQDTLAGLNPVYSVGWQVAETLIAHGKDRKQAAVMALELLRKVGIPEPQQRYFDYPHQFSGGQRQRIMIAMAIGQRPEVLIADEPTSALDVTVQAEILDLLKELQRETGMALVIITHDLGIVREIANRVVVMSKGKIVETGLVSDVFDHPRHAYTRQLLDAIPGRLGFRPAPRIEAAPILEVSGLCKSYQLSVGLFGGEGKQLHAVQDVNFVLHRGQTIGIIGESGSGKSSLARTILGLETISAGSVRHHGVELAGMTRQQLTQMRRQVQVVFQDPTASLNPRMSVRQIICEPWKIHRDVLPRDQWEGRLMELLSAVDLRPEHADRHPHQFSGGQRQRIAIARALALRPDLIVCDEAVSALDVSIQAQIIALLRSLQQQYGLSYLFIAHDLGVVRDFADHVLVMYQGRVVESDTTETVFEQPAHAYTRRLLRASSFAEAVTQLPADAQ